MKMLQTSKYLSKSYLTMERWMSYYYQVKETLEIITDKFSRTSHLSILEIGPGNKITSSLLSLFLRSNGIMFDIVTIDVDQKVRPDVVGDLRCLPFKNNEFDISLAFEVLEHIPFEHVPLALEELRRTTKEYVVLSLPHNSLYITFAVKLPKLPLKTLFLRLFDLPLKPKHTGEHYWEIGIVNYPTSKIRKILEKNFKIIKSFRNPFFPYHHFFLLRKS